jgi:hypothetical protein
MLSQNDDSTLLPISLFVPDTDRSAVQAEFDLSISISLNPKVEFLLDLLLPLEPHAPLRSPSHFLVWCNPIFR